MLALAVISTHPIQYYAPLFRRLAETPGLAVRVFYLWDFGVQERHDPAFGQSLRWDIDLLEGYDHEFVPNRARQPGTHHFRGVDNPTLPARVAAFRPDAALLVGYNHPSFLRLLFSPRLARCKFLLRGDSHRLVPRRGPGAALRRALLAALFKRFAGFLYVGAANRRYYLQHGVPERKLFFAPHAVDNDRFSAARPQAEREAREWRRELGIDEGRRVVLFAGKYEEKKRPLDLLEAFRAAAVPGTTLLFVGGGPLEGELRRRAEGFSSVRFAPFQNQSRMPRTLAAADVVALPSAGADETWGLIVNESLCLDRPVVVSDRVGCAEDLVEPGANGWVFPAGDVGALAGALRQALGPGVDLRGMGQRGRELVSRYHYRDTIAGLTDCLGAMFPSRQVAARLCGSDG
ncbi:MAG TPA: glycosyltransferase family 4 protein [Gemmataceae bacterium]|nr:glycosyltransferase family 4 protein [Gemmataceae bacterium]